MTNHDTIAFLKSPSPYDEMKFLFPEGFPMRDPFPMVSVTTSEGRVYIWIVDLYRLSSQQFEVLTNLIANTLNVEPKQVSDDAIAVGGFCMSHQWIERVEVGAEGWQRKKELEEFLKAHDDSPSPIQLQTFFNDQYQRWINGDEIPPPLPTTIEEVEPNLRTPELEESIKKARINSILASKEYSVFDVLTGRAIVDVLNEIDPDNYYDLVDYEEDDNDG